MSIVRKIGNPVTVVDTAYLQCNPITTSNSFRIIEPERTEYQAIYSSTAQQCFFCLRSFIPLPSHIEAYRWYVYCWFIARNQLLVQAVGLITWRSKVQILPLPAVFATDSRMFEFLNKTIFSLNLKTYQDNSHLLVSLKKKIVYWTKT